MVKAITNQLRFKGLEECTSLSTERWKADIEKAGISGDHLGDKLPKVLD